MAKNKKLAIVSVIAFILVSVAALAATLYPNARVSFTGMDLVTNGTSTQAFVDVSLKNINATTVSFCIKYDPSVIQLSEVGNNTPIENPKPDGTTGSPSLKPVNLEHKYFEQNTDAFPASCFKDENRGNQPKFFKNYPIIGIADQALNSDGSVTDATKTGFLIMNFIPNGKSDNLGDNIKVIGDVGDDELLDEEDLAKRLHIMANEAEKKELCLGRLSFCVVDVDKLLDTTPENMNKIIDIIPFTEMDPLAEALDDEGVYISYLGEDGQKQWYTDKDNNVEVKISLEPTVKEVKPQKNEINVSSYDIFMQGGKNKGESSKNNLLNYLNNNAQMVTLVYMDDSEQPAKIKWTADDIQSVTWDPKGGSYDVTHKYNDDFNVTVKVNVIPVKLKGFEYDNEDITYWKDSETYPTDLDGMQFPQTARAVLDTYIPNGGIPALKIYCADPDDSKEITQFSEIPEDFRNKVVGDYTFWGHLRVGSDITGIEWLSDTDSLPKMPIKRRVVATEAELPTGLNVVKTTTSDSGTLTIVVENIGGSPITDPTDFTIKLPSGEIVPSDIVSVTYDLPSTGKATITITPDIRTDGQENTAKAINLGGDGFKISSTEAGKNPGPFTDFSTEKRNNHYTEGNQPDGNYLFDYSSSYAAMFQVKAGASLPLTIKLPRPGDRINTTYNGFDGTEPGELETFKIDDSGWTVSGDINTIGEVITATGKLDNYTYTNYGYVSNDNNRTVTIKYKVTEAKAADTIADIDNFTYSKRQVGYDYDALEVKSFVVQNIGSGDIHGLHAVIKTSTDSTTEGKLAFVETKTLPILLAAGESTTFDISTKIGMGIGKYVSEVKIYSNNDLLKTFTISFEVVEEPVYNITLKAEKAEYGTAETDDKQTTAVQGDTITIIATPKDAVDYKFNGWTCDDADVTFGDASEATTTFKMPGKDVTITANFVEKPEAKLRLSELLVKDTADKNQKLYEKDGTTWKETTFDPVKREYYVAVPADMEKVKLWFKVIDTAESSQKTLMHAHDGTEDSIVINAKDTTDLYYKSDESKELVISPKENVLTLTLTSDTDSSIKKDYIIHVFRKLKDEDIIKFNFGNSPYGLIMRDSAITNKNQAKEDFKTTNNYKFTEANAPDGATAGVHYRPEAWIANDNKDLSDTALFVTDISSIADPGYKSIQNSIGGAVDVSTIKRSINVRVLNASGDGRDGSSNDFSMVSSDDTIINLSASGTITELNGKRIRPDCYKLTYSFTDFDGTTTSISRPIIILSPIGDVNISGTTDNTDKERVLRRFSKDLANNRNVVGYDTGGRLNELRICDVNKDGSVNAIDANFIRAKTLVPFYTNLVVGGGGDE